MARLAGGQHADVHLPVQDLFPSIPDITAPDITTPDVKISPARDGGLVIARQRLSLRALADRHKEYEHGKSGANSDPISHLAPELCKRFGDKVFSRHGHPSIHYPRS